MVTPGYRITAAAAKEVVLGTTTARIAVVAAAATVAFVVATVAFAAVITVELARRMAAVIRASGLLRIGSAAATDLLGMTAADLATV